MDKKKNGVEALGAEIPKALTREEVGEFLKMDLSACISILDAIYRDQATMDVLGDYLYGRFMNAKNAAEAAKKTKEDLKAVN